MKSFILIWIVLLSALSVFSQQVIATSGNYHQTSTASISWTLGETIIGDLSNSNLALSQGFQQGNQLGINISINSASICEGESVNLSASPTGGSGTYSYSWTSNPAGFANINAVAQDSPTVSTWYIVNISDGGISPNVIDSVFITVNPSNFNLAFTASQTTFTSPPFNVNIQNQTPNAVNYNWQWNMGDGNSFTTVNPVHTYGWDGLYTISALATDTITGCFDTISKTNYINCSGGSTNPCNITAEITPSGQAIICSNDSFLLTATYYPDALYTWIKNGVIISGALDSVFYAKEAGMYQVMITDTVCSEFSDYFNLINYPSVDPIILSNGVIMPCTNDSMELYVSGNYNSVLWNTGETTPSIYTSTSGYYVVTAIDANSCVNVSDSFMVNTSLINVPDICIVGIDSATNKNRIIWERQQNALIDSFRIYRETFVANEYELIGAKAFSEQSIFIDQNSNPAQQAYRYRISAIDTCGEETPFGEYHKTNHLTINAGLGNTWNLIWDGYVGFDFSTYRIYRSSDSNSLELLTQIQSTLTSFTDLNPPAGDVFYQIEVVSPHPCYPDSVYSKANTNYNSSRSNTINSAIAPNTSVQIINNNAKNIKVYPNPNKGNFTLEMEVSDRQEFELNIFNSLGSHVLMDKFEASGVHRQKVSLLGLAKGMYFIRMNTSEKVIYYGKIIVN